MAKQDYTSLNFLVIARKYNPDYPEAIGGVIVSSENLIKFLRKNNIKFELVDTNKKKYKNHFIAFLHIISDLLKKIRKCDHIAMNLRGYEILVIAPIAAITAMILCKGISLRVFGGNIDLLYESNWIYKKIIDFVMTSSTIVFLQTKSLVDKFNNKYNAEWLPTCRFYQANTLPSTAHPGNYTGKFIFIAQIKKTKGVDVILGGLNSLNNISVDFYGPLEDYTEDQINTHQSTYKGILNQSAVSETISQYDFLLLPTYHPGEGYPGVIIESYAVGTPVITTKWNSISELVDDGKNGILVDPNNIGSFVAAIKNIDVQRYNIMRKQARDKFDQFDCDKIYRNYIKNLV